MVVISLLCISTHRFNSVVRYPSYSSQQLLQTIISFLGKFSLHHSINIDFLKLCD